MDCLYYRNLLMKRIKISKSPIFIVGCGHSGTSLLLSILDSHSKIYGIPYESRCGFSETPEIMLKQFDRMAIIEGKPRWVEKTPSHIRCIGRLLELRQDAKILLIIRDGRDVAISIKNRSGSLEKGITRWIEDNHAGKNFWNHPNVYVLKYEDLIKDFQSTISGVLSFLGESYEPEMEEFYKIPRLYYSNKVIQPHEGPKDHNQYRNWQINQPLFDGRGKWKQLNQEELTLINSLAKDLLIELEYIKTER